LPLRKKPDAVIYLHFYCKAAAPVGGCNMTDGGTIHNEGMDGLLVAVYDVIINQRRHSLNAYERRSGMVDADNIMNA